MPSTATSIVELVTETVLSVRPIAVSAAHDITIGTFFKCDASAGGFTINLPAAGALLESRVLIFTKTDVSANVVTISRAGSDVINGATTQTLPNQFDYLVIIDDENGGSWYIIGET